MLQRPVLLGIAIVLFLLALFAVWPAPFDAEPWTPPAPPALEGALAENTLMQRARTLPVSPGHGLESLSVGDDGTIYGGTQEGDILASTPDGGWRVVVNTGGRPLGTELDADGTLVVADAYKGLLRVELDDGSVAVLSTEADGGPFRFTDDMAIARDGTIYFTDASDRWPQSAFIYDLLETRPRGRLLRFDPRTKKTTVLARDLYFANGVALAGDESFLVVNETWRYRLQRYWLTGEKAGKLEPFLENLPGFPDNVTTSPRGTFWVALYTVRKPILDRMHPYPWAKELFAKLPAALRPKPLRHGFALEVSPSGDVLRTVQDPTGESFRIVTSALEHDGKLYLGSLEMGHVGVLDLDER